MSQVIDVCLKRMAVAMTSTSYRRRRPIIRTINFAVFKEKELNSHG